MIPSYSYYRINIDPLLIKSGAFKRAKEDFFDQRARDDSLRRKIYRQFFGLEPPVHTESGIPSNSSERKAIPLATGVLDYFPAALREVAKVSKAGNDKHNPGEPLHWTRGKSTDHADSLLRHLADRGGIDPDTGARHSAEVAWRALALLQQELEEAGEAPLSRGSVAAGEEDQYAEQRSPQRPTHYHPRPRHPEPNQERWEDPDVEARS